MTTRTAILLRNNFLLLAACYLTSAAAAQQDSTKTPRVNLHFQATYIYQYKPAFHASYSGPNSLSPHEEHQNSLTSTLYLGARLWRGAELYINPEVAGGSGLSGAFGLAASTNGETFRVGNPEPTLYLGRAYLSQTFAIGQTSYKQVGEGANEVGGNKPVNFLRLMLGKFSLADIFDANSYANSPRTQFLNWCLMNNGAWDFAANVRGYTYAFAAIYQRSNMAYKVAVATLPTTANGSALNTNLGEEFSINAEADRSWKWHGMPGAARLLGYCNDGHMGNYQQAINNAPLYFFPDVTSTREFGRTKYGICLNAEQQLSSGVGAFVRAGWNDGQNETWAFTEADQALALGVNINGKTWKRENDNIGIAAVANGLSQAHRKYLSLGGMGFQLGDGTLQYASETAAELYYSCKPFNNGIWLSADYQFILNPGYNKDRGPVSVFGIRVHAEL